MANTDRRQLVPGAHSRGPVALKPLRSEMKHLSDEQLLAKLSGFGIALDRISLGGLCEQNLGAEQVAKRLIDAATFKDQIGKSHVKQVENCVAHLWQRWFPEQPSFDGLEDKMLTGYELIEAGDGAGACRVWLEGWAEVLALLDRAGITSIEEFDRRFSAGEFVLGWIYSLDQGLWNAGLHDPQFFKTRITYCEEGLRRIAAGDKFFAETRRQALAESYFELGDTGKTDTLYREWLSADPQWGWGWISWARCYLFARAEMKDLKRGEQILLEGLSVDQVRDSDQFAEGLAALYEKQGRLQEAQEMLKRARPGHAVPRSGPKVGRNDPCPCGSGKKFKKCCGSATSAA